MLQHKIVFYSRTKVVFSLFQMLIAVLVVVVCVGLGTFTSMPGGRARLVSEFRDTES